MLKENFHIAVPTAFYENESLNVQGTIQHIKSLYNQGVKSVLVCGSTGEQHSLTLSEKIEILLALTVDEVIDQMEIIFGVSSVRQKEAEELARKISTTNIAGILLGYPPYLLPTQEEAFVYSKKIIELANKPTILYNNPRRTGFDLSSENIMLLSKLHLVVGLKEAGDKERIVSLKRDIQHGDFYFYAGGELDLANNIHMGFNRLSSISGNVYPKEIKQWFNKMIVGQPLNKAESEALASMLTHIFTGSPLVNLKKIIGRNNIPIGKCRSPLGNR